MRLSPKMQIILDQMSVKDLHQFARRVMAEAFMRQAQKDAKRNDKEDGRKTSNDKGYLIDKVDIMLEDNEDWIGDIRQECENFEME